MPLERSPPLVRRFREFHAKSDFLMSRREPQHDEYL